jgi:hypothetical protein
MEKGQVIKSLGYILKKEKLASLATNKDYHELILEDLDPFQVLRSVLYTKE